MLSVQAILFKFKVDRLRQVPPNRISVPTWNPVQKWNSPESGPVHCTELQMLL